MRASAPAKDAVVVADGDAIYILRNGRQTKVALRDLALNEAGDQDRSGVVRAPMHGKVLIFWSSLAHRSSRGQRLAIIEAMKMEHTLVAPTDGTVADISVPQMHRWRRVQSLMRIVPTQRTARINRNLVMPLHLIKLCVGCDSVSDLEDWIKQKLKEKKTARPEGRAHPYDADGAEARAELTNGGSLYLGNPRTDRLPRTYPRRSAICR